MSVYREQPFDRMFERRMNRKAHRRAQRKKKRGMFGELWNWLKDVSLGKNASQRS